MKKKIKKWGDSLIISFTKEEAEIYGLIEGDIINLDDMLVQKVPTKKKIKGKQEGGE